MSTDGQRREIAHDDLLRYRVQHGAAQLPAIARVAGITGRAGIDHQHPTDATDDLLVRMAVEHDVGVGLAKPVQLGAGGHHIAAARLPRRRMHHQDALAVDPQLAPMGLPGEPAEQWPVDVGPGTRPRAGRAEEDLLVIAQDGERVELAQPADHRVREAILVDAVAEARQRIDRTHGLQRPIEAIDVAVQVGDDTELQQRPLSRLARSIFARAVAGRPAWWASHSRSARRSSFLSDAGLRRFTVRRMTMNSSTATGQWNQTLCRPVKALITTRKPAIARGVAMARSANQSERTCVNVAGSCLSRTREGPSFEAATASSATGLLRPTASPRMATR